MTIEKKSLISSLQATRKAIAAKEDVSGAASVSPAQKMPAVKAASQKLAQKLTARKTAVKLAVKS